jgi:leader peptidase (prepilin peptidase)/N-methyltransferase
MRGIAGVAEIAALLALYVCLSVERARTYRIHMHTGSRWFLGAIGASLTLAGWLGRQEALTNAACVSIACCGICAATDLAIGYIFDRVLAVSAAMLVAVAATNGRWCEALLGAAIGGGALLLPFALSRGRAMGFADVKFAATTGLGLGVTGALHALWFAAVLGGGVALLLLGLRRASRSTELPFGAFLALGTCIAILRGYSL